MSYLGIFGFPCSGQDYMVKVLQHYGVKISETGDLHGVAGWRAMIPGFQPTEQVSRAPSKEGRNRRVTNNPMSIYPLVHLIRHPWHAIAAAATLSTVDVELIRDWTGQDSSKGVDEWHNKVRVLTRAFPVWYDEIRDQAPDMTLKIEELDKKADDFRRLLRLEEFTSHGHDDCFAAIVKHVDYKVAVELAGENAAGQVEVIARNLYKNVRA